MLARARLVPRLAAQVAHISDATAPHIRLCSSTDASKVAFMFPGQGSQFVGMAKDFKEEFSAARLVLEEVDEALQSNLSRMMLEGDQSDLNLTENAQPAIFAHSMCVYRSLAAEGYKAAPVCLLGHSVGHFAALAVAKSLRLGDAAKLLRSRGQAMQQAADKVTEPTCMKVLLPSEMDGIKAVIEEVGAAWAESSQFAVDIAAVNTGSQLVLSGTEAAVDAVVAEAKQRGLTKRAVALPVSAPFHCSLMHDAEQGLLDAMVDVEIKAPRAPVISNVTAAALPTGEDFHAVATGDAVAQICSPVRWHESLQTANKMGAGRFISMGPGDALTNFVRQGLPEECTGITVSSVQDMKVFLKSL